MRVRKSAIGSVCIVFLWLLPTGFHDAGNFTLERHAAETDTAHFKFANEGARAAANAATIAHTNLELGLLEGLSDFCSACHLLCYPRSAQRKAETLEELAAFFVSVRGCGQSDVHALDLVDSRVINFGKNQLIFQTQRVVAAAVERVGWQTTKIANTRQNYVAEAVDEFVHLIAAQSDRAADGHALADLEIGDRLLGSRDDRLLSGDLAKFHSGGVQQLGVLAGLAEADVHGDFRKFRHGHDVLPAKMLHQRRHGLVSIAFLQSTLHCLRFPLLLLILLLRAA